MIDKELELNEQGHARRRFLKQAATVAWASPFIVTMMSRTAQAQTAVCGELDPNDSGVCVETAPCGTAQVCVPSPIFGNPTRCACASLPG